MPLIALISLMRPGVLRPGGHRAGLRTIRLSIGEIPAIGSCLFCDASSPSIRAGRPPPQDAENSTPKAIASLFFGEFSTETDPGIEREGFIALQVHSGPRIEMRFKDILIASL